MSRIGRMPVIVPPGVEVVIDGTQVRVKGPKGELQYTFPAEVNFSKEGQEIHVIRLAEDKFSRSLHGSTRAILNNMVHGVHQGFEKRLEVNGVGYRAEIEGNNLVLHVGYSHPVKIEPPSGISFSVDGKTRQITVMGFDKQQVGQVAANIREVRLPEPYQGKGIKYLTEKVRRKAGKTGK